MVWTCGKEGWWLYWTTQKVHGCNEGGLARQKENARERAILRQMIHYGNH